MQPISVRYSGYARVHQITLAPGTYIQLRVPTGTQGEYNTLEVKVLENGTVEMYSVEPVSFKSFDDYNFDADERARKALGGE